MYIAVSQELLSCFPNVVVSVIKFMNSPGFLIYKSWNLYHTRYDSQLVADPWEIMKWTLKKIFEAGEKIQQFRKAINAGNSLK